MRHRVASLGTLLVLLAVGLAAGPALGQAGFRPRFAPQPPFAVAVGEEAGRQALALADLNGDQRPDLVSIAPDEIAVRVQLNDGDGAFGEPLVLELDVFATAVVVADVASPFAAGGAPDGIADLLIGGDAGELVVAPGAGDGTFDPEELILFDELDTLEVIGLAVADLDGAGGLDLAVLDIDGLLLLCDAGAGLFAPCGDGALLPLGEDSIEVLAGEFNGDAHADLVVLDRSTQLARPFYGAGDGTVTAANPVPVRGETTEGLAVDMAVGRVDGDAIDDVVVVNFDENLQFLAVTLLGDSRSRFRTLSFVIDFLASAVALGDFDDDAILDVMVGYADSGLTINVGEGQGGLQDPFTPVGSNTVGTVALLAADDLNGDAVVDLVLLHGPGDAVRVLINDTGPFCAGDCNADGEVTIDELLRGVNIALGQQDVRDCLSLSLDGDAQIEIHELIAAVGSALAGCPAE